MIKNDFFIVWGPNGNVLATDGVFDAALIASARERGAVSITNQDGASVWESTDDD